MRAGCARLPFLLLALGRLFSAAAGAAERDTCAGAEAELRAAGAALDAGRPTEAERLLLPLATSHTGCGQLTLELARLRAGRGETAEAERLFERAAVLAPGDARAQALFAEYWLSRGQLARADYLATRALALDPDCAIALVVQGRVLDARGRSAAAAQVLGRAVELAPSSAEARYQLGTFFFRGLHYLEAARELEKAVALRPDDAPALDYLGVSYELLGQAAPAESAYAAAAKACLGSCRDDLLDYNYGRFLLKQGRLEESRQHLDRAVTRLPASRAARYQRSKLNLALGQYAAAREDAERALSLRDGGPVADVQLFYLLATIYRRLGEKELAARYAELTRQTRIPNQD